MPTWKATAKSRRQDEASGLQDSLVEAVLAKSLQRVCEMLRKGATASARDDHGHTPLNWAASEGCPEITAQLLLSYAQAGERLRSDAQDAVHVCKDKATTGVLQLFMGKADTGTQRDVLRLLKPNPMLLQPVLDYVQQHFGRDLNALMEEDTCGGSEEEHSQDDSDSGASEASLPAAKELEWHVVSFSPCVAVREMPSVRSRVICGKKRGELLQLGGFDETRTWRRAHMDNLVQGWVPIAHPVLGPLLLPLEAEGPQASRVILSAAQQKLRGRSRRHPGAFKASLAMAVKRRDLAAVQGLLRSGAEPSFVNQSGETPLFESVCSGDIAVTALLLLHRADPCARSSSSSALASDFAADDATKALLAAFSPGPGPFPRQDYEALHAALASLPSEVLRPTVWTLRGRRRLTKSQDQAWLHADLARMEGRGPQEGSPWALCWRPPSPPSRRRSSPESFPPEAQALQAKPSVASRWPEGLYEVSFRPCVTVHETPGGAVLCRLAFGERLSLGDWDHSGAWRACAVPGAGEGWVQPEHPLYGPVLRSCDASCRRSGGDAGDVDQSEGVGEEDVAALPAPPPSRPRRRWSSRGSTEPWQPPRPSSAVPPPEIDRPQRLPFRVLARPARPLPAVEEEEELPPKPPADRRLDPRAKRPSAAEEKAQRLSAVQKVNPLRRLDPRAKRLLAAEEEARRLGQPDPRARTLLVAEKEAEVPRIEEILASVKRDAREEVGVPSPGGVEAGAHAPPGDMDFSSSSSPLLEAVRSQDLAEVLCCLEAGCEPNEQDAVGETPLFESVARGDVEITTTLLLNGADPLIEADGGLRCTGLVEDPHSRTILDMFLGRQVPDAACEDVLAALNPKLRAAVRLRLGLH